MPHSLKSKIKSLCYKGEITEKERDRIIHALEQQPKMQDCEHCIHTYGTLGCCDMVNNEWIYDCEFGKEQYKKEHEQQPCEDCISREDAKNLFWDGTEGYDCRGFTRMEIGEMLDDLPSVTPSYNSVKSELKPSEDCISRTKLLSRIDAERKHLLDLKMDGAEHIIVHHARRIIEDMPSVTPQPCEEENPNCTECRYYDHEKHHCPRFCKVIENTMAEITSEQTRWIPCSEKMPDINIHVLAQFVMGGMAECYYAHNWWHIVGGFRISGDEVIAWMPLPQPYTESEDKE